MEAQKRETECCQECQQLLNGDQYTAWLRQGKRAGKYVKRILCSGCYERAMAREQWAVESRAAGHVLRKRIGDV